MRFNFTGRLGYNDLDSKVPYLREGKSKAGNYKTLSFYLKTDSNDIAFVEMFGMKPSNGVIKTAEVVDGKTSAVEVEWVNRNDPDVVKNIASNRKNYINLNERHEYISPYDAVEEIVDALPELKDKMVTVSGNVTKNFYNGKIGNRFTVQNISLAKEDAKTEFKINATVFFSNEDVDIADWKEEKKIRVNGYTSEYFSDKKEQMFVPQQFIFDASKVKDEDEKNIKRMNYVIGELGVSNSNGKLTKSTKKNKVYAMAFFIKYINSAEIIEFDESCLTDKQREGVEIGVYTLDDFKKNVYGNRVTEFRIMKPDMTESYKDGFKEADFSVSEFAEKIYAGETTKIDEKAVAEPEVEEEKKESDSDNFDIFG